MIKDALPWQDINEPNKNNSINKRRVDGIFSKQIWWTKNHNGQIGLQFQFKTKLNNSSRVKKYDEFIATFDNNRSDFMLIFLMKNSENKKVFYRFCLDIIGHYDELENTSDEEILESLFLQVAKWHSLFKISPENFGESQQLGLLGELTVINDTLLKKFNYKKILKIWRGPIPEPQDFISSNWALEIKSQWMISEPIVAISSLRQLDTQNGLIFLNHRKFKVAAEKADDKISLNNQVGNILEKIGGDNFYTQYFMGMLHGLGFDEDAPYAEIEYVLCQSVYYQVIEGFPSLMRSKLPKPIDSATYKLDLGSLNNFRIDSRKFERQLV